MPRRAPRRSRLIVTAIVVLALAFLAVRLAGSLRAPPPQPAPPAPMAAIAPVPATVRLAPLPPAAAPAIQAAPAATPESPAPLLRRDFESRPRLEEALRAGEPRAYAYAALHCGPGSDCDPVPGDRAMSLAAAQVRAGLAIRSGDAEAIYDAGRAIASDQLGRNPLRGAAWMLVACDRGYDCSAGNALNEALRCDEADLACRPGANVTDLLAAQLGPADYARAFALAAEYDAKLARGELADREVAFGREP
jgi:hypothetical protein